MPSRFAPLNGSSDTSSQIAQLNRNFAILDGETDTKVYNSTQGKAGLIEGMLPDNLGQGILINDTNANPIIYMARNASGNPVLKVAKTGKNATTAADSDLIFNSAQNVFKVANKITITPTVPAAGAVTTTTQAHGLPHIPAMIGYIIVSGEYYALPFLSVLPATGVVATSLQLSADATNVKVTWTSPAAWVGAAPDITIYLLQETAT